MIDCFDLQTILQFLEILSEMFLKRYAFLKKFLIYYRIVYLEKMHIKLLNLVDNGC